MSGDELAVKRGARWLCAVVTDVIVIVLILPALLLLLTIPGWAWARFGPCGNSCHGVLMLTATSWVVLWWLAAIAYVPVTLLTIKATLGMRLMALTSSR